MADTHAPAAPQAPAPEALKTLQAAIDKAAAWQQRMGKLIGMIAHDVANPAKSMYHLWSIQLLPTADMSQAEVHLQAAVIADSKLIGGVEEMRKPNFLLQDEAHIEKIGQEVSGNMAQARQEIRSAANAVYEANMKVLDRDVGVASGFVAADKFIIDKAPEVMGDIVLAITKNKHARAATINATKVVLNATAHASADYQGIKLDKKDMPDLSDVALDAAIDEIADWVPEGSGGLVKKTLTEMFKDICVNIAKTARGKHGKELQDAVVKAVNDGVTSALESLAKEIPGLNDSKIREALMKPVLKAAIAAEKAVLDGKSPVEAAKDAARDSVIDQVISHGTEKVTHHASDYHEPTSETPAAPAHTAPAHTAPAHPPQSHHPDSEHPEAAHDEHARPTHHPDHEHPDHASPVHAHTEHDHPNHEHHEHNEHHEHHHHAHSGHHGHGPDHAHSGASQAVKDAWLKEHLQFDVAAHNAHAST